MKFSLAFLIALALSGAVNIQASPVRSSSELNDIFDEFLALVPKDKVVAIFLEYLAEDSEVQAVVEYVQTDDFKELVKKVESIDDVINFYNYLDESGLDIYKAVNALHEAIGLAPLVPGKPARNIRITGGMAGLIEDIKAVLPLNDIKALYYEKLETSPAFAQLVERFRSPKFQELIDALRANEEFQKMVKFAKEAGVNIEAIKDLLATVFGLKFSNTRLNSLHRLTRGDLNDDLQDFLDLLPIDQIEEIVMDYYENDPEIKETIKYLQSGAFRQIVQEVEDMKEARDVLGFLQESGLNAYGFLNTIHELLGIPAFKPYFRAVKLVTRATGGLSGLIADVKAILPIEDIKTLYYKKLEDSPAFIRLIERLSSPQFQEFIDAVLIKEEARVIINKLKSHGVDLQAIADLLTTILGLKFPDTRLNSLHRLTRGDLNDDLQDFLDLLPIDQIEEIVMDYYENDPEIKETIKYLQSGAFRQIVQEVEDMKEARDVLGFLQESGLNAYGFLNTIHELLGIPAFKPYFRAVKLVTRATGGLSGLIADVKAILPIEDIKTLYYKKLEDSPAFIRLIERLSSPQFQEFIDAVLIKEEARVIINKLKSHGVDLQAIADLLTTILGLKFPKPTMARASEELRRDLIQFLDLLPLQDIIDVSIEYLSYDVEFQKAAAYLRTNEFKILATDAEQNDEFRSFLGYLDGSGLPASEYINKINEYLEIPEVVPSSGLRDSHRTGTGVRGLLDDIEALLPRESIKQMYDYKMKTSKSFSFLVERLQAPEFQAIIDRLVENEAFQKLGYRAAEFGIDLEAIVEFLSKVFGIEISADLLPARLTRALQDDFQEFVDLLPMNKIRKIVTTHYLFDNEFKRAYTYIKSKEFHQLIRNLHEIPEYNELLKSLEEAGLDVEGLIANIHKQIGFENVRSSEHSSNARGIADFVSEIKAVLPIEDIKALYKKKIETSDDFVRFVEVISSKEFQAVTDALFADEIFQSILHRLQDYGIDLNVVSDLFLTIFGIKTPPGVIDY